MLVHLADDVLCRELHDEAVLLDLESQRYFGLDAIGLKVWNLLSADPNLDHAVAALAGEFEVEIEQLRLDVNAFVEMLIANRLASKKEGAADSEPSEPSM